MVSFDAYEQVEKENHDKNCILLCMNTTMFGIIWRVWLRGVGIAGWKLWKSIFRDKLPGKTDFLMRFYWKYCFFFRVLWTILNKKLKKNSFSWKIILENYFIQSAFYYFDDDDDVLRLSLRDPIWRIYRGTSSLLTIKSLR